MLKRVLYILYFLLMCGIYGSGLSVPEKETPPGTTLIRVEDARFYALAYDDIDGDGKPEILSAGQQGSGHDYSGYIVFHHKKGSRWQVLARHLFKVTHLGKELPTRIRSVVLLPHAERSLREIYAAGRAGGDETGVGFLSQFTFNSGDNSFKQVKTHIFQQKESTYTHGYPLNPIKLPDSAGTALVYGGFSSNPQGLGDTADVRIFSKDLSPLPFAGLSIPLRVNALTAADVDNDGREDIIIAGRTIVKEKEQAAFACWTAGKVFYKIFSDELPGRLRALLAADIDKDGKKEIISGGRSDIGDTTLGRLDLCYLQGKAFAHRSRYCWTGIGATRIRVLLPFPQESAFFAIGRSQVQGDNKPVWAGFIAKFGIKEGRIVPCAEPGYFRLAKETRFRAAQNFAQAQLLIAGFTLDKEKNSTAILLITPAR